MQPKLIIVSRAAAVATAFLSILVLFGWAIGSDVLRSFVPGMVTMKANAALGMLLAAVSLWFASRLDSPGGRLVLRVCAGGAIFIGATACVEYLFPVDLGLNQLLFREAAGAVYTSVPGRMAPTTALSLLLLGVALLLSRQEMFHRSAGLFAVLAASFALVSLTTFLYAPEGDEGWQPFTRMAVPTAFGLMILSTGVVALLLSQRPLPATLLARAFLPRLLAAVILVPLALGWLRVLGERAGFYNTNFGVVLMVAATISLLSLLVWWNARTLARIDQQRSAAEEALRTSEKRTRQIIESAYDAFISMDDKGRVTDWNPRAEKMFGFSRAQALGRVLAEMIIPERYRERHRAGLNRFLATGEGTVLGKPIEVSAIHADGREFPVELSISPMAWNGTWNFNAFIHDITEQKEKAALTAASAAKDHFIAMLSHELRTPLTPVMATILDLEAQPDLTPPLREAVEMIQRNVELEARLIDDLLDVTRIAKGKLQINHGIVDVNSVLRDAIGVCKSEVQKKKLQIDFDPQATNPTVEGDAPRLMQVFWNLLQNAVKFSPPGAQIVVRTRASTDGFLAVEIEDQGIGMSAEVLARIFTPFEQGDASISQRFGGLGLGLALSKALVEAHGGKIEATSAGPDLGTLMRLHFRTIAAALAPAPTVQPNDNNTIGLRVLIVEDHDDTRLSLERLLAKWGHTVASAETLAEARARVGAEQFDLLLTDLGLPDGHGLDLMREIRAQGGTIPGIALSGFGTEMDAKLSLEAGFAAHFTKPVGARNLKSEIARIAGLKVPA